MRTYDRTARHLHKIIDAYTQLSEAIRTPERWDGLSKEQQIALDTLDGVEEWSKLITAIGEAEELLIKESQDARPRLLAIPVEPRGTVHGAFQWDWRTGQACFDLLAYLQYHDVKVVNDVFGLASEAADLAANDPVVMHKGEPVVPRLELRLWLDEPRPET